MDRDMVIYAAALAVLGVLTLVLGFQPACASTVEGAQAIQITLQGEGYVTTVTELPGQTGYTVTVAGYGNTQDIFMKALGATAGAMASDGSYGDVSSVGVVTSANSGILALITDTQASYAMELLNNGDTFNLGLFGLNKYNTALPMVF